MTSFFFVLLILTTFALDSGTVDTTEPADTGATETTPDGPKIDTGSGTENPPDTTEPAEAGTGLALPDRANLTQCMDNTTLRCFVGNYCIFGGDQDDKSIREMTTEERMALAKETRVSDRKRVEECSVGATLRWIAPWKYHLEYHTTKDYLHLPIIMRNLDNLYRYISKTAENGSTTLHCAPACEFYSQKVHIAYPSYYWSAKFKIIGAGLGVTRANLTRCMDGKMLCYVGNRCVDGEGEGGNHTHFIDIRTKQAMIVKDSSLRKRVEECDLGVTFVSGEIKGTFDMKYHTTSDYKHLIFDKILERNIEIRNDTLNCTPKCEVYDQKPTVNGDNYFWSAKVEFRNLHGNLHYCYNNASMMCWAGDLCTKGSDSGSHDEIIQLDNKVFDSLKKKEFEETTVNCDVAFIMIITKTKGAYLMKYYTTTENMDLPITIMTHKDTVKHELIIKNGTIECSPKCTFKQKSKEFYPRHNGHVWLGVLLFYAMSPDDVALAIHGKIPEKKIEKNEEGSNIGTIIIVCACVFVACLVVAIVAGTMIQRRQATKVKRRQAALQASVAARNNSGSKISEGRANDPPKESAPLIKKDQMTEPESEMISDSLKDSEKTPKGN